MQKRTLRDCEKVFKKVKINQILEFSLAVKTTGVIFITDLFCFLLFYFLQTLYTNIYTSYSLIIFQTSNFVDMYTYIIHLCIVFSVVIVNVSIEGLQYQK